MSIGNKTDCKIDWVSLEGTIDKIYHDIDKYKDGLSPKAKEKGFAFLLNNKNTKNNKNRKTVVIADKELITLGLAKVGNYVKLLGWFNDQNVFLATATIGNIDKDKLYQIKKLDKSKKKIKK